MADKDKYADEMLTDDELEKVAGGTYYECTDDMDFLRKCGVEVGNPDKYDSFQIESTVADAWAKVGIICYPESYADNHSNVYKNSYSLNGKEISREEAHKYALKVTGH
ncbi:MAG: hypothetical protein IKZ58_09565 [Selenomonadaceae bacterium]|nr:hypothetical protein [Selenomonadaceae bacterium]